MIDIRQVFKNPILLFTASRYVGYGLRFVRGILVARFLGPYFFGIWGFLLLVQQYLSYTSFGLQYATTVELAIQSIDKDEKRNEIIANVLSTTLMIATCLVLLGGSIQLTGITLFEKYSSSGYIAVMGIIVGIYHLQQVFTNIYRVYGQLGRIVFAELLNAVLPLVVVFVFKDEELIAALLGAMVLSGIISLVIFVLRSPFEISFSFNPVLVRRLLSTGIPLLAYNVSFHLIAVTARTIISAFYSVETMGYYSLANSVTSVTLLGVNAVTWVFVPRILFKARESVADHVVAKTVQKINDLYGTSVFLAVFGMILLLPLLFIFLPQYKPAGKTLDVLLLSQAILSISFGYNQVAIARKQQLKVAGISVIAVIVVLGLGLSVAFLKFDFVWIAVSVLAGSFVFTLLQTRLGSQTLNVRSGYLKNVLPLGSLIATVLFLLGILSGYPVFLGGTGLVVFVLANKAKLSLLVDFAYRKVKVI